MSKISIRGLFALLLISLIAAYFFISRPNSKLPLVAIANYGPHISLQDTIQGIRTELRQQGFVENQNIRFEISNVNYQHGLIAQMLTNLSLHSPKAMVVMTTPVAQYAKNSIHQIPLVYSVVTDPVETGLLKQSDHAEGNLSGASDQQNLTLFLAFSKKILPQAKSIGLIVATGEPNDHALAKMLQAAALKNQFELISISINEAREIPQQMQAFKNKVDFIYVGMSGPVQPALPAIVAEANKMKIPVFNADSNAVKNHQVLASFGVDYQQVGMNTGKIVAKILKGETIRNIAPIFPSEADHQGFISKKCADRFGISIPKDLNNLTVVE